MADDKPTPTLMPGDRALTSEGVADLYRRLTNRELAPEEMARLRARFNKPTS